MRSMTPEFYKREVVWKDGHLVVVESKLTEKDAESFLANALADRRLKELQVRIHNPKYAR